MKTPTLIVAALVLGATLPAAAEETRCTGRIGAVALDNSFVLDGASCVLNKTRANGSIVVVVVGTGTGTGTTLQATSVSINGNLQAEGAAEVVVNGRSTFGGSVQIVQGGSASIAKARINGDIPSDDNVGPLVADANVLGGSLQAFQNTGGVTLTLNRMKGNLQCKENEPAPTGGGNKAASKEDQCSRL